MAEQNIPMVRLPSGEEIPALGQGTRGMAEDPRCRDSEIAALRAGIDLGLTVVDTAGRYADGGAEELVREAIVDRRDEVFLISRIAADEATGAGTAAACAASLRRLGTDRIDLLLLQRCPGAALAEIVATLTDLITRGMIRHWGVTDFDVADVVALTDVPGGTAVEADQVRYNLTRRGIERDLLPRCRRAGLPVIAYSPLAGGRLPSHPVLARLAERHRVTPGQLGLAWSIRQGGVCAVTRARTPARVRENRAALDLTLSGADLAELDRAFPPPAGSRPAR